MTVRNRHDRTNDHDGTLDSADVDVDEIRLPDYPARTTLHAVLTGLLARLGTKHAFTLDAVFKRTMQWQTVPAAFTLEAIIGTDSVLTYPGFFTINAAKFKAQSGSRTLNAVIKRNKTGNFTMDAVKV